MAVAIFDVDGTIIDGTCMTIYAKYLYKKKIIKLGFLLKYLSKMSYYVLLIRLGRFNESLAAKKALKDTSKRLPVNTARHLALECFEKKIKPKIIKEVANIIKKHAKKGHKIILISSSPKFVLEPLAKYLNIKHLYATDFVCKNNKFKAVKKPYSFRKGKIEIIKKLNLNLKESYAYSDSMHDLPLLEMVKYPTVINPDRRLKKIALKRGWFIHCFK